MLRLRRATPDLPQRKEMGAAHNLADAAETMLLREELKAFHVPDDCPWAIIDPSSASTSAPSRWRRRSSRAFSSATGKTSISGRGLQGQAKLACVGRELVGVGA